LGGGQYFSCGLHDRFTGAVFMHWQRKTSRGESAAGEISEARPRDEGGTETAEI